ncbi:MAG: membrane lipoprotein lipid attachment site-containing protein [Rickettsiales bacterium]
MSKKIFCFICLVLTVSGCSRIYDWADGVGKHMPTIGEPCRHWQCITTYGKQRSEQEKWAESVVDENNKDDKEVIQEDSSDSETVTTTTTTTTITEETKQAE